MAFFVLLAGMLLGCSAPGDESTSSNTASAVPLALQSLVTGTILPTDSSTKDLYRVQVDPDKTFSIDFSVQSTLMQGYIRVFTKGGTPLLQKTLVSAVSTAYFEFDTGNQSEVYVEVSIAYPSSPDFQYQLAVYPDRDNGLLQDAVSFEPNNTNSTAHVIGLQSVLNNSLAEGILDHRDIYAVQLLENETYTVMATFASGDPTGALTDLQMTVSDEQGALLVNQHSIAYGQTVYHEITPQQTGMVYIALFSPSLAQDRYYGYKLTVLPATSNGLLQDDEDFEPNNTASTAYPITLEETYASDLKDGTEDHADYYSVDIAANETYSISFANDTGPRNGAYNALYLTIEAVDGTQLLDNKTVNNSSSNSFEFTSSQNTKALIGIVPHPQRYADNFQYRLLVVPSAAQLTRDTTSLEPNETPSTAVSIALTDVIQTEFGVDIIDRYDYFTVPVQNGVNYNLTVDMLVEPGTPNSALRITVMADTGTEWLTEKSVLNTNNTFNFTAYATGEAVIKLKAPLLDQSYVYQLHVDPAP
jgi:hypothetical protein